jgi:hypothetical protein
VACYQLSRAVDCTAAGGGRERRCPAVRDRPLAEPVHGAGAAGMGRGRAGTGVGGCVKGGALSYETVRRRNVRGDAQKETWWRSWGGWTVVRSQTFTKTKYAVIIVLVFTLQHYSKVNTTYLRPRYNQIVKPYVPTLPHSHQQLSHLNLVLSALLHAGRDDQVAHVLSVLDLQVLLCRNIELSAQKVIYIREMLATAQHHKICSEQLLDTQTSPRAYFVTI